MPPSPPERPLSPTVDSASAEPAKLGNRPVRLPRWLAAVLYGAALGAAFWRLPQPAPSGFFPPPEHTASPQAASLTRSLLPATHRPAAVTLAQLPDGRLAAAWSALDSGETNERSIWFSVQEAAGWRPPQVIASRPSTAAGTFAHTGQVDRPLLYAEGGWLHLWYVSHDGLAGASLKHSVSTNGGQAWSKPEKLPISPLAAGRLLPGSPPVALADGGLGLPLSRTALGGHSEWLRLSATGKIVDKQRLPHGAANLQPLLVVLDAQHALAFLRDTGAAPAPVHLASTANGGRSWQAGGPLHVTYPGSPLAVLRLPSGRLLLAGNARDERASLNLWLSADGGQTWQFSRKLENSTADAVDFSDPVLLLGRDGRIHLAFSWYHEGLKLLSFNEAWLTRGTP